MSTQTLLISKLSHLSFTCLNCKSRMSWILDPRKIRDVQMFLLDIFQILTLDWPDMTKVLQVAELVIQFLSPPGRKQSHT